MDTRSKSAHRIGIIIILAVILLVSSVTVFAYPMICVAKEDDSVQENTDYIVYSEFLDDNALDKLYQGSYVLYQDMVEQRDGKKYQPSELFLSDEMASYASQYGGMDEVRSDINSTVYEWRREFYSDMGKFLYSVYDESGSLIMTNAEDDSLILSGGYSDGTEEINGDYKAVIVLHFSGTQILNVSQYGDDEYDYDDYIYSLYAKNSLMSAAGLNEHAYCGEYPAGMTVVYAVPIGSPFITMQADGIMYASPFAFYTKYYAVTVAAIFVAVGFAALLLPLIKPLGTGNEKLFRMPLELAAAVIILLLAAVYCFTPIVRYTEIGRLSEIVVKFIGSQDVADVLVMLANIAFWCLIYGACYAAVASLRHLFVLGPWKYIKGYSLIYRFFAFIKRQLVRFYRYAADFDLSEDSNKLIVKIVAVNFVVLLVISLLFIFGGFVLAAVYSVIIFAVLRKYFSDIKSKYQKMLDATSQIAEGNLDVEIDGDLGMFNSYKTEIKKIQSGFKKAVEKEVRSRNMKTELITNVSHDLKTPLTAIITYVNLLKDENITEEERRSYIDTLDRKSMRLKGLIEDLFDISKADSGNVSLTTVDVDLASLIQQVCVELKEKSDEAHLDVRLSLPERSVLSLDSQKTYRIFENLLVNCIKYSLPHTRVYISMTDDGDCVCTEIKNIAAAELNVKADDLTERFVRGDMSRNTEGSGLGLAIAKSFTELQGGSMKIDVDGDLFKVSVRFNKRRA